MKQLGVNLHREPAPANTAYRSRRISDRALPARSASRCRIPASRSAPRSPACSSTPTSDAMEQAGVMRTLAEPTLTAISGEKAEVQGRRRVQHRRRQDRDTDKDGGKHLQHADGRIRHRPRVHAGGAVGRPHQPEDPHRGFRTDIEGSVPLSIGGKDASANVLSLRKRLADTTVELPSGGSMMIAGLIRDDVRQAVSGLPGPVQDPGARHALPQPRLRAQRDRTGHHRDALSRPPGGAPTSWPARRQFQPRPAIGAGNLPRPRQPHLRHHRRRIFRTAATTASSASSTSEERESDAFQSLCHFSRCAAPRDGPLGLRLAGPGSGPGRQRPARLPHQPSDRAVGKGAHPGCSRLRPANARSTFRSGPTIRAFAVDFAEAGTGSLFVMMPSGSPNEHAAKQIEPAIVKALLDGGASRKRIIVQHYDASQHGSSAAVRLSYTAVTPRRTSAAAGRTT